MDNVRLRRLKADYEALRRLARLHPRIDIEGVVGNPPERYRIHLKVKSLREKSRTPRWDSSWRRRWLTALTVTQSSSAARLALRRRATASKVSRHWMGGMRRSAMVAARGPFGRMSPIMPPQPRCLHCDAPTFPPAPSFGCAHPALARERHSPGRWTTRRIGPATEFVPQLFLRHLLN